MMPSKVRIPETSRRSAITCRIALLALLSSVAVLIACNENSVPSTRQSGDHQVDATVASFRVTTSPDGVETVERIAIHDGKVRLTSERDVWHLFDLGAKTITTIDEIDQTAERVSFDRALSDLRAAAWRDEPVLIASVRTADETESVAGFDTRKYVVSVGRGYEREIYVSQRPLIHSDFFLLRLATDSVADEDLPALRSLIRLLDDLDGYPVIDRSRITLDDVEYTVERRLIAVGDQRVPGSWFELPRWATEQLTKPPAGPPPAVSPPPDRSAPAEESPPSGSVRTDP